MAMSARADLVVANGIVANADRVRPATIVVTGGKVEALLDPGHPLPACDQLIDAHGNYVLPGGVDPHCHIGRQMGEYPGLDDYEQATTAALWGGTTTVVDFAIPETGESPLEAVQRRQQLAKAGRCDAALHGCVIQWTSGTRDDLASMATLGVRTVKLFTTYRDSVMAGPDTVLEVMRELQRHGGMAFVHAEADHVIEDAQACARAVGHTDPRYHAQVRPAGAETAAVCQVLATAEHLGTAVYFVHQTTPEAVDSVRAARRRGVLAYTETCPHYLSFDESVYEGADPARYICCPPMRAHEAVDGLLLRAAAGDVDTIGSDHCCYSMAQKLENRHDATRMPNGMPGVETRLPATYTALVAKRGLPIERFVSMVATNPASLNGLPQKGAIAVGADADLVVLDTTRWREVDTTDLHMATDFTPYQGIELTGWPLTVVSNGRVVLDRGELDDPGPVGRTLSTEAIPRHLLT